MKKEESCSGAGKEKRIYSKEKGGRGGNLTVDQVPEWIKVWDAVRSGF